MSKQFFVVVISLLALTSPIVSAAEIDWDSAPRIDSKAELARHVENGRRKGQTVFNMVLTNFTINTKAELDDFNEDIVEHFAPAPYAVSVIPSFGTGRVTYIIDIEYPGTRVANAYLSGNIYSLNYEEWKLYNAAIEIIDEARKYSSPIEKERYIHDEICRRTTYYDEKEKLTKEGNAKPFITATGALINGKANCQGYADAFYMLMRMLGFNVWRIHGYFDNDAHAWNAIELGEGKFYGVDVQVDDGDDISYTYFNATSTVMKKHHWWVEEIIPNLQ